MEILDTLAPNKVFQSRVQHKSWVSEEMKTEMAERDVLRETTRMTKDQNDWNRYKKAKNNCTLKVKKRQRETFQGSV